MNGNYYICLEEVKKLAGIEKSQVYNLIDKKQLIADSETIGPTTRHKIRVSSLMLFLEYKQKWHEAKAKFYQASYDELKKGVKGVWS